MAKKINALELRQRFGEIMDEVRYRKEPYIVKKNGREVIVLMDIEVYKAQCDQLAEDVFIEEYSESRIQDFLKEDTLNKSTQKRAKKLLGE